MSSSFTFISLEEWWNCCSMIRSSNKLTGLFSEALWSIEIFKMPKYDIGICKLKNLYSKLQEKVLPYQHEGSQ